MKFTSYSEEWLDFILTCRSGKDSTNYDIVIGGVANDKVFNTIELYLDNLIDKKEALQRLRYEKPNLQLCFRSQKALGTYLHYGRSVIIGLGKIQSYQWFCRQSVRGSFLKE